MDLCSILHDVLIVGSGPCGLAVAARLCEQTPSAIFTDEEHRRYHWIKKHAQHASIKNKRTGQVKTPKSPEVCRNYSTLVLDGTGKEWMSQWNRLFKTFEISHLRSPMFFHPDPLDRDGLLSYAYEQGRDKELVEIPECVGKEISKHKRKQRMRCKNHGAKPPVAIDERDRKDYFTPSRSLFRDYCECVIDRYGLRRDLIQQERVQDIDFGFVSDISETDDIFTVKTDKGIRYARTVVLAIGPGNTPSIPPGLGMETDKGCCHAMQIREFPDPSVAVKIRQGKQVNIMVVGGGLTSAQVTDMAIRHGATKVWQIMRGRLRVKPFDVDLNWMGKFKNHEEASFWSADTDEERLEQIREARGGGSITPRFHKILKHHISTSTASLHQQTQISSAVFSNGTWDIETTPPIPGLPRVDYVYFATGIATDFKTLPFLNTLDAKFPVRGFGGLPGLTDDLMWRAEVPLFVTGRLAALRLGPAAGNLAGARSGAERVVWAIEELLAGRGGGGGEVDGEEGGREGLGYKFRTGVGGQFCSLEDDCCM